MNTNPHNAPHNPPDDPMNSAPSSGSGPDSEPDFGQATLRLIAGLPAPAGLEERVQKALRAAPSGRVLGDGRVLAWPTRFRARIASGTIMESNWMRAAAAAAIVFVVVGGGWGVYSRVQPGPAGKVIVMPQLMPRSGGISGAGAIRVPATIPGPKVKQPATKPATPRKAVTSQHPATAPMPQPAASQ
jgi:hypothetical protein